MNNETPISSDVTVSIGIEKIEPMKIALGSFLGDTFGQETRLAEKLNQVIENQNKVIDYLNQLEKEILDEWLRKYNTLCIAD